MCTSYTMYKEILKVRFRKGNMMMQMLTKLSLVGYREIKKMQWSQKISDLLVLLPWSVLTWSVLPNCHLSLVFLNLCVTGTAITKLNLIKSINIYVLHFAFLFPRYFSGYKLPIYQFWIKEECVSKYICIYTFVIRIQNTILTT